MISELEQFQIKKCGSGQAILTIKNVSGDSIKIMIDERDPVRIVTEVTDALSSGVFESGY